MGNVPTVPASSGLGVPSPTTPEPTVPTSAQPPPPAGTNPRNRPDAFPVEALRALARLARVMERAAGDLSLAQYRVLSAVAGGDERASRIAAKFALGKPALSASVEALSKRGLIERSVDSSDQRATALRLTTQGRRVLHQVEGTMLAQLALLTSSPEEFDRLCTALVGVGGSIEASMAARFHRPGDSS